MRRLKGSGRYYFWYIQYPCDGYQFQPDITLFEMYWIKLQHVICLSNTHNGVLVKSTTLRNVKFSTPQADYVFRHILQYNINRPIEMPSPSTEIYQHMPSKSSVTAPQQTSFIPNTTMVLHLTLLKYCCAGYTTNFSRQLPTSKQLTMQYAEAS